MKEAEIEQFRQKLLLMRSDIMELADTLKEAGKTVELDQARVGRLSRMDAMQGQQMALEAAHAAAEVGVGLIPDVAHRCEAIATVRCARRHAHALRHGVARRQNEVVAP